MNLKKQSLYIFILTIAAFFAPTTQANHMESFQAEWEAKLANAQSAMVEDNGLKMSVYDFYKEAQTAQADLTYMIYDWAYHEDEEMFGNSLFNYNAEALTKEEATERLNWLTTFMAPYAGEYYAILKDLYPVDPTHVFTDDEIIRV